MVLLIQVWQGLGPQIKKRCKDPLGSNLSRTVEHVGEPVSQPEKAILSSNNYINKKSIRKAPTFFSYAQGQ